VPRELYNLMQYNLMQTSTAVRVRPTEAFFYLCGFALLLCQTAADVKRAHVWRIVGVLLPCMNSSVIFE
jgi:hypothetical protein